MENFNFYSPTEFVFGKGRAAEAGNFVKKYGGSKVLIHYGDGRTGGFVQLDKHDVAEIYKIAAHTAM